MIPTVSVLQPDVLPSNFHISQWLQTPRNLILNRQIHHKVNLGGVQGQPAVVELPQISVLGVGNSLTYTEKTDFSLSCFNEDYFTTDLLQK